MRAGRTPRRPCGCSPARPRSATKSDAGERNVPIVPTLERRLIEHRERYPNGPGQPAFPTRNGTRQNPDNIRLRILAPIRDRANRQLEVDGRLPIAHVTPHTLRRTFASILAVCDVPPRPAMYLMGHTDPAAEILGASRGPVPGESPGRSRSNEPLATNGRAARQISGTNPEPSYPNL